MAIIENPYRSFFWHCSAIEHILRSEQAIVVQCDFCMMGGSRLKRTALLCNNDLITGLAVTCDGSHEHLPWDVREGVLATKLETAYPHQFCKHFVSLLLQHLTQKGCRDGRNLLEGDPANSSGARVVTTRRPKRLHLFRSSPNSADEPDGQCPANSARRQEPRR